MQVLPCRQRLEWGTSLDYCYSRWMIIFRLQYSSDLCSMFVVCGQWLLSSKWWSISSPTIELYRGVHTAKRWHCISFCFKVPLICNMASFSHLYLWVWSHLSFNSLIKYPFTNQLINELIHLSINKAINSLVNQRKKVPHRLFYFFHHSKEVSERIKIN